MDGQKHEYLVIKDHGQFCTSLRLNDKNTRGGEISINSKELRWTHPGMLQYTFNTILMEYVKTLKEEEYENVLQAVSDALCVTIGMKKKETDGQAKQIEELEQKNRLLAERAAKAETELEEERERASVSVPAPDGDGIPWKLMYENLVDKLVGRM